MTLLFYRFLGWGVPCVILAGSAYTIMAQHGALDGEELKHAQAVSALQTAAEQKASVDAAPPLHRFAAVSQDASEETRFLNDLRLRARQSGASIVSWTSHASQYGTGATPIDPADADLLTGLVRISCDIDVQGPYSMLRKFIDELTDSPRLFNLTNVVWHRADNGTELTMSVVRYVTPDPTKNPVPTKP